MSRYFFILLQFIILIPQSFANSWQNLGSGLTGYAQTIFIDTTNGNVYVSGPFAFADSLPVHGIAMWDGNKWDSLGQGNKYSQQNLAILKFQNQIYSDGRFSNNSSNCGGRYYQGVWDSLNAGVDGPIHQFKVFNNQLFVGGLFTTAGGQPCNMLAMWDGLNWSCFNLPYNNTLQDFIYYDNELILGGNFFDSAAVNIDLAAFDGTNYRMLGHPIFGAVSYVNALIEYKGELYIGGAFTTADGNEANNIMRWNGTQWRDVSGDADYRVDCFKIYNDELYVSGGFQNIGGINTGNLAKWDGNQWSKVTPSIINGEIYDMEFYNDELYIVGSFWHIDTLAVNHVAKYSGLVSINEHGATNQINIYPNPTSDNFYLKINFPLNKYLSYSVYNSIGEKIIDQEKIKQNLQLIDMTHMATGLYVIVLEYKNEFHSFKVIKN